MAQDIGLDLATGGPTVTMPTVDVTDGNTSTLIGSLDFGTPTPLEIGFEWIQTTLASAVDFAYLQVLWSHDDSTFSDVNNFETVGVMQSTASTDVPLVGTFPCRARFAKFQIENQTGGTLDFTASNSAIVLTDLFGDQV